MQPGDVDIRSIPKGSGQPEFEDHCEHCEKRFDVDAFGRKAYLCKFCGATVCGQCLFDYGLCKKCQQSQEDI